MIQSNKNKIVIVPLLGLILGAQTAQAMQQPEQNKESWQEWLWGKPVKEEVKDTSLSAGQQLSSKFLKALSITNFTLGNGLFFQTGLQNLLSNYFYKEYLISIKDKTNGEIYSLETLEYYKESTKHIKQISDDTIEAIKRIFALMHMPSETQILIDNDFCEAHAPPQTVQVSHYLSRWYDRDTQEAIIAHECMHIKNKDVLQRGIAGFIIPGITYGILKSYERGSDILISYLQDNYCNKKSSLYNSLELLKKINFVLSNNFIVQFTLNYLLTMKLYRYQEARADYGAALALHEIASTIRSFEGMKDKISWIRSLLSTHPSKIERIKAMKLLKEKVLSKTL